MFHTSNYGRSAHHFHSVSSLAGFVPETETEVDELLASEDEDYGSEWSEVVSAYVFATASVSDVLIAEETHGQLVVRVFGLVSEDTFNITKSLSDLADECDTLEKVKERLTEIEELLEGIVDNANGLEAGEEAVAYWGLSDPSKTERSWTLAELCEEHGVELEWN